MPPAPPGVECKKVDFFPECEQWEKKDETGKSEEIKPQVFQILGGPWSSFVCLFIRSFMHHTRTERPVYVQAQQSAKQTPSLAWYGWRGRQPLNEHTPLR